MVANNINTIKGKLTLLYQIGEYGYCTENSILVLDS